MRGNSVPTGIQLHWPTRIRLTGASGQFTLSFTQGPRNYRYQAPTRSALKNQLKSHRLTAESDYQNALASQAPGTHLKDDPHWQRGQELSHKAMQAHHLALEAGVVAIAL